jgi:hypothetical protein
MALAPKRVDRGRVVVAHFTLLGVVPHPSADMVLETASAAGPSGSERVQAGPSEFEFEALVRVQTGPDQRN